MSYQNVGKPKFFIDHGLWLHSLGMSFEYITQLDHHTKLVQLNPSQQYISDGSEYGIIVPRHSPINYVAYLGHNGGNMYPYWYGESGYEVEITSHINGHSSPSDFNPQVEYSGFSIFFINDSTSAINIGAYATSSMGAISIGSTYTMPSPNLSLTMSREYGSTNEFTTYNGSSMSNTMNNSAPRWGDLGAWDLGSSNPAFSKSGRRTWQLKFSYMDDGDLFGSNQMLSKHIGNTVTSSDYDDDDLLNNTTFEYNLLTDDNFFSQVWQKTLGMTLPCILQPDSSNNNPDQFAIVRGVANSLKATRSSPSTYDISLSLEEVW